ncbi:MAG: hypothetical protein MZV70_06165, partial [Desulfobacterales bacterium]|nr:hypothetical protein [Desulfobacterales bacterium]
CTSFSYVLLRLTQRHRQLSSAPKPRTSWTALPEACCRVLVSATLPDRVRDKAAPWFRELPRPWSWTTRRSSGRTSTTGSSTPRPEGRSTSSDASKSAVRPKRCLVFASSNAQIFNILRKLGVPETSRPRSSGPRGTRSGGSRPWTISGRAASDTW